ncbi:COP9 signalosome complex subunit 7 [Rhynchospora pubera]|uniref:COP9 signalosome complex subunit 7 n=1 Tax=Rhynchospora pubera TaxID=906938 RepID=A0AAV8BNF7_9POAL|nr:COP9 signalosome complex subunit 7 [Rhynchospora pubera]KAJ4805778.1 COP9 signalosome complex subunit 7 [Rhynchospora pubera]
MEMEKRQADLIEQFTQQAEATRDPRVLASIIADATCHPSLFAFSEILSVSNISKLEGTQFSSSLDLLQLFAYGTWSDYKSNAGHLPSLLPDQVRKMKQLSVLTLAETKKVLPYDKLMHELDVSNVRELEDFLINECMYSGIVRGKLDQLRRCFEVQFAAGRDIKPEQLDGMIEALSNWLGTSDNMLQSIQEKIKWADMMSEANRKHKKEVEDRTEEVKKTLKVDMDMRGGGPDDFMSESGAVGLGSLMDLEEDRVRPKRYRRRNPMP